MNAPKTLTYEQCECLLDALQNKNGTPGLAHRGIRNYCIALVMLDAGLRVSEVVGLDVTDLIFNNVPVTSLLVRADIAKNRKERSIPISTRLCEALKKMHETYWSGVPANVQHRAFRSRAVDKPLSRRQVHRIISYASTAALGRSVNPHVLRHTFASRLMRVTSMRTVQELLGHKHIVSTQIYTHPDEQDKKSAIDSMIENDSR